MAQDTRKNRTLRPGARIAMALGMLLVGVLLLYPGKTAPLKAAETPVPTAEAVPESAAAPALDEETIADLPEDSAPENTDVHDVPEETEEPGTDTEEQTKPERSYRPIVYDERSFQLVTDMVYAFRHQVPDRERIIAEDVEALKEHDPALGEAWGGIMEYWDYADNALELNYDALPADLPQDDSLCIVVLGFQLLPDGSMSPEMLGRCELALAAAKQFPKAYLAVTGGGTAVGNAFATEAGVMARWFLEQGVDESRIIVEDRSSTTEENAKYTLGILTERYPQIRSIAIVTSDYHVPLGCTLFTEAALLYGCEYGAVPWTVDAHLALRGYGLAEYTDPAEQALYIWALANPQQS